MDKPLCFVIMPYGRQRDPEFGVEIDFDAIYREGIEPAIRNCELEPVRSDFDRHHGLVHRAMFERILLCEYAVADLTTCNPNVLYELGIRHATRRATTLPIFAAHQKLPFNVGPVKALPYALGMPRRRRLLPGKVAAVFGAQEAAELRQHLTARLADLRDKVRQDEEVKDSPLFQILSEWSPQPLAREKTDTFRDRVVIDEARKQRLEEIRRAPDADAIPQLDALRDAWCRHTDVETASFVDLLLSYRHVQAWERMIDLVKKFPAYLQRQILIQEQFAFALNRRSEALIKAGKKAGHVDPEATSLRDQALKVLSDVEERQGPSAETCGLLGRIHKSQWMETRGADSVRAAAYLNEAIACYRRGSEADLIDPYPAINLLTLLDIRGTAEDVEERNERLSTVEQALRIRRKKKPDYWDYATLLEVAFLKGDREGQSTHLGEALTHSRESWEPESTANNLSLLRDARAARREDVTGLESAIDSLRAQASRLREGLA